MRYNPSPKAVDPRAETATIRKGADILEDDIAEPIDPGNAWRDGYRTGIRNSLAACIERHQYEAARVLSGLLVKLTAKGEGDQETSG